jgi:TolB protein
LRLLPRVAVLIAVAALFALAFAASAQAAFPGLNGKIAFERTCCGFFLVESPPRGLSPFRSGIWTMNPDGSVAVNLSNPANDDLLPAWSADGKRLAFTEVNQRTSNGQIWTMNGDGSDPKNLSNDPSKDDAHAAWSPDGSKIVFTRNGSELWVMNSDGSGQHRLIAPPSGQDDGHPAWSPDGSKIAFDRSGQIYVVSADGSGTPTKLSNNAADGDSRPNWAPDGSKIVFGKVPGKNVFMNGSAIWIMGPDGSGPKALTKGSGFCDPGSSDAEPAFSPDGTMITFVRVLTGCAQNKPSGGRIWVMGSNASNPRAVSNPSIDASDTKPDWQPLANVISVAEIPPCTTTGAVSVSVSDPTGFKSGPKAVHFRFDGGAEQTATTTANAATIIVPAGRHALEYWGENQVGDQEASHHTASVLVDQTRPHLVILRDQHRATFRRGELATVTIKVTDSGGSGLTRNPSRRRLRVSTLRLGTHTVRATATDGCGNAATASLRYRVATLAVAHRRVVRPRFTG